MLLKSLRNQLKLVQTVRFFAADAKTGATEWGIKYDDECLNFEKEWKKIADKVEKDQAVYLDGELSEL